MRGWPFARFWNDLQCKLFKEEFKYETYLTYTKNVNHTLALFRFRISSNNLCIETGRYTRPRLPENQRNCIYCKSYNVENELHFLLECDMYKCERGSLFIIINEIMP